MERDKGTARLLDLSREAVQANEEHQRALQHNIEKLEAELGTIDKLLDAVDVTEESDLELAGSVTISGSVKATAPISTRELSSSDSPFHSAALKRNLYQSWSGVHPMKTKELDALTEAVRVENYRRQALNLQKSSSASSNIHRQNTPFLESNKESLDWDRIADKMSSISMFTRTAQECKVRWLGEQHPEFNREAWSEEELSRVKSLAAGFANNQPDWVVIAEKLETKRTPLDCMRHATTRKSHQWSTLADERLLRAIRMYGHDNWHLVARYVSEDVTPQQCSNRFQRTIDPSIKRTAWTPAEDARLCAAVAAYGSSWVDVAACIPGRHNDQCRDRWTEQLNLKLSKNDWTDVGDRILLQRVQELQDASWADIAEQIGDEKTEDMCRARYFTLQRGGQSVLATSITISDEGQEASLVAPTSAQHTENTAPSTSTVIIPAEYHTLTPTPVVFLDPVVSADPKLHKHRRPRTPRAAARSHPTTLQELQPTSAPDAPPPPKRRKKRK